MEKRSKSLVYKFLELHVFFSHFLSTIKIKIKLNNNKKKFFADLSDTFM